MDNRTDSQQLFQEELEVLEEAKALINRSDPDGVQLHEPYRKLADRYEKLLKTSMKLSRISDIQGRALIEREQEILIANESLKELERLRRNVISDISHELGTPMTALQGYVKALLDGVVPLDRHYLEAMYDKVLIMNQLIDDLFELAKLQGSRMSIQPRELLLEDVAEPLGRFGVQEAERKNVRLTVSHLWNERPEPVTAIVKADLIRIEQVMNNLVVNALKFTPPGGEVTIRFLLEQPVRKERWTRPRQVGEEQPEAAFVIEVEDTGTGIPEDELRYVFDRFYRGSHTKQSDIEGSGLGLAIAKGIVDLHGGAIGVESQWGKGSIFYFSLPVHIVGGESSLESAFT